MKRKEPDFEDLLPIELKLRLLEAELDRLNSDLGWLEQRRDEVTKEMQYYEKLLHRGRRRSVLRRVK
ncbi:MAG: hypothetical protein EHM23_31785 [Acidobacteria bacterium]|nr:MAG: hypothetical protein EHM23_31785 [Acidobacteriota bacterium]